MAKSSTLIMTRAEWKAKRDKAGVKSGATSVDLGGALEKFHKEAEKGMKENIAAYPALEKVLKKYLEEGKKKKLEKEVLDLITKQVDKCVKEPKDLELLMKKYEEFPKYAGEAFNFLYNLVNTHKRAMVDDSGKTVNPEGKIKKNEVKAISGYKAVVDHIATMKDLAADAQARGIVDKSVRDKVNGIFAYLDVSEELDLKLTASAAKNAKELSATKLI